LDGLGFKPSGGQKFSYTSRQILKSTLRPVQWVQHISLWLNRQGRGADNPPLLALGLNMGRSIYVPPLSGCLA